ncbi:hypothetical protein ACUNWD_11760 [Sunxiuqinia sp. A32]|uniref:hypothetical protein n=1 Tax=Sunxiuqinia sp. A32 TaxID=3461496 RepID=UPI0040466845
MEEPDARENECGFDEFEKHFFTLFFEIFYSTINKQEKNAVQLFIISSNPNVGY